MAQMKKMAPKPVKGKAAASKTNMGLVQDITNRFRVTAREARDIVTAVSTAAQYKNNPNQGTYGDLKKDVVTQIKEVGKAAVTGKGGTKPSQKYKGVITRNPGKKGFDNNASR
jgi:hypothetical protein